MKELQADFCAYCWPILTQHAKFAHGAQLKREEKRKLALVPSKVNVFSKLFMWGEHQRSDCPLFENITRQNWRRKRGRERERVSEQKKKEIDFTLISYFLHHPKSLPHTPNHLHPTTKSLQRDRGAPLAPAVLSVLGPAARAVAQPPPPHPHAHRGTPSPAELSLLYYITARHQRAVWNVCVRVYECVS